MEKRHSYPYKEKIPFRIILNLCSAFIIPQKTRFVKGFDQKNFVDNGYLYKRWRFYCKVEGLAPVMRMELTKPTFTIVGFLCVCFSFILLWEHFVPSARFFSLRWEHMPLRPSR